MILSSKYEPQSPVNGEYYLTEVIERYAKEHPIAVVEEQLWIAIGYPEDIDQKLTTTSYASSRR
jgi:bifunctional N-acetylglucosamine-1-phosphate-uridyltransferase/glucosamine-1-phosphate-acetyltransferase GlmU-like protein